MKIKIRVADAPNEQGPQVSFVDTETGEELDIVDVLDAGVDIRCAAFGLLDHLGREAGYAKSQLKDNIEQLRKDGAVRSKGSYGGVKLSRSTSTKWDGDRARKLVDRAVEAGLISKDRADASVPTPPTPKPDGTRLKELIADFESMEGGKEFAVDLSGCRGVAVSWKPEIVAVEASLKGEPVAEQAPEAELDPVDAVFG